MCQHCRSNAAGGQSVHHGARKRLIGEIAESMAADLDSASLFEIVGDDRVSLEQALAMAERKFRKKLSKLPGDRLWSLAESL